MALCLLSRGLQNCGLFKRGFCFHLSKAMILLLFDSAVLQSIRSAPQPKQQRTPWKQLSSSPDSVAEHSIHQGSHCGPNNPPTEDRYVHYRQQTAEVSKKHCLLSSNSSLHSPTMLPADRLCLVCDAHCFTACVVCDQDFCSTHLYACPDCDNQYCSRCLDDHRTDGHWSDSDTAAELSRGWSNNSGSGLHVGSLHLSPLATRHNVLAITEPCINLCPVPSQVPSHTRQSETSQSHTLQSKTLHPHARRSEISQPHARQRDAHRSESSHTRRPKTSPRAPLTVITSSLVFLLQAIRQGLSSVDCVTVNLLSQSETLLEVSR